MSDPVVRLAARGDGITASGAFVAGAAPGDMVEADGSIAPGPHRQTPPCRHFALRQAQGCGGCQLQHIDDETYAGFVADRTASALAAQGIEGVAIRPPHLSPPYSRRRIALKALKQGKRVLLGFSEAKSHRIVDLAECPIMRPELFTLLAPLRGLLATLLRERGVAEVQATLADQGVDLAIKGGSAEGLAATESLTAFARGHALARLVFDHGYGAEPVWEPEPVTITLGGVAVPFPPGSFLQATEDGEAALIAAAREATGGASCVADLFSGLGTFAFAIGGKVHAVEGTRDAILSLASAAKRFGRPIATEHRDLFRRPLTAAELARFDAVILDPPRAGAKEQAAELAASQVPRIAYVSCNPATFARDARTLIDGGYALLWVQPVGQFRWSTHVELAAAFIRQP